MIPLKNEISLFMVPLSALPLSLSLSLPKTMFVLHLGGAIDILRVIPNARNTGSCHRSSNLFLSMLLLQLLNALSHGCSIHRDLRQEEHTDKKKTGFGEQCTWGNRKSLHVREKR